MGPIRVTTSAPPTPNHRAQQAAALTATLQPQAGHQKTGQEGDKRLGHGDRGKESAAFELADVIEALDVAAQGREGKPGDAKGKVDQEE